MIEFVIGPTNCVKVKAYTDGRNDEHLIACAHVLDRIQVQMFSWVRKYNASTCTAI